MSGVHRPLPDADLADVVAAFLDSGRNVSSTARTLARNRITVLGWLKRAAALGIMDRDTLAEPNAPNEAFLSARDRMARDYQQKKAKGDWRKPVLRTLPPEPFRLKLFGDPHLDDPGCDAELFIEHMMELDEGIYGVLIGDTFNNWTKSLAHLWKGSGDPSSAWTVFEHVMEERGRYVLAACSGNHDDWTNAPADPIDMVMKRHGVIYRKGAVRLALAFEGLAPIFVALRHKWRGGSIYSPAHGIHRAAIFGWRDDLMVGGHTHVDEPRMRVHPDGFVSHACQLSSFKDFDEFADVQGFMPHKLKAVWDLVLDPRRPNTDPDRIKCFWSSEAAAAYIDAIR